MTYSPPLSSDSWGVWSGSSFPEEAPLCAGCRLRILDKYYLSAVAQKWHTTCLKCSECGVDLENQISCFEKEGHIYCKDDYLRIYANNRQCYRCLSEIQASDLVIKARHTLFHVDCFRCATCDLLLQKGDLFGMFEDALYCKAHWEHISHAYGGAAPPGILVPSSGSADSPPHHHHQLLHQHHIFDSYSGSNRGEWTGVYHPPMGTPPEWYGAPGDDSPDYEPPGHHADVSPSFKKRRGRKKRKMEAFNATAAASSSFLDLPNPSPGGGSSSPSSYQPPGAELLPGHPGCSKTKRARTSFKHHQLRIMRGHFQVNQNPDSRELKMLSQKTGLDKKVLQVWFQNARAKWRRVNMQSGSGISVGALGGANVSSDGSSVLNMDNLSEETGDSDSAGLHQQP